MAIAREQPHRQPIAAHDQAPTARGRFSRSGVGPARAPADSSSPLQFDFGITEWEDVLGLATFGIIGALVAVAIDEFFAFPD
jgi:hypothetical protein